MSVGEACAARLRLACPRLCSAATLVTRASLSPIMRSASRRARCDRFASAMPWPMGGVLVRRRELLIGAHDRGPGARRARPAHRVVQELRSPNWARRPTRIGGIPPIQPDSCLPQLINVLRGEISFVDPDGG